jgi:hypothetical protein
MRNDMIANDAELNGRRERIAYFQDLLSQMRRTASPELFPSMVSGFRAEIEKMQCEVGCMSEYRELTDAIGTKFRAASRRSLASLRSLRVPKPVVDFYASYEPSECAEGQVRLWPIADILRENQELVPGAYVSALGYVVFATTYCGDAYCFDISAVDSRGDPPIVLISHEVVSEDTTADDVSQLAKPVAKNLCDFLQKFTRGELDEDCIY